MIDEIYIDFVFKVHIWNTSKFLHTFYNVSYNNNKVRRNIYIFRYIYVNLRPWPRGYPILDMFDPPPAGLQSELIVLDLAKVGLI